MITIAMKPTGALDRNTISSINRADTKSTLTAQDIHSARNMPGSRQDTSAADRQNASPGSRQGTSPAGWLNTSPGSRQGTSPAGWLNTSPGSRQDTSPAGWLNTSSGSRQDTSPAGWQGMPVSQHPAPAPAQIKLPKFEKPIRKGQKVPLESGMPLSRIRACFGWNTQDARCDVDVSAFLLGADGKVLGDSWFVFYGQTESPDRSCQFLPQANSANGRETISIDFGKLNRDVMKIVFVLTIHDAITQKLHFGMMKDAYIRILDAGNLELASFQMTDYYPDIVSMMIGELYNYKGKWKFNAIGNGVAKDLAGLCALYGVQITS